MHSYCKLPEGLHRKTISPTIKQITECTISSPRVILLCFYREFQPKNPRKPHTTGPKPHQKKPQQPNIRPRPQTKPKYLSCRTFLLTSYKTTAIIGNILSYVERQHLDSARFLIHSLLGFRGGWIQISGLNFCLKLRS